MPAFIWFGPVRVVLVDGVCVFDDVSGVGTEEEALFGMAYSTPCVFGLFFRFRMGIRCWHPGVAPFKYGTPDVLPHLDVRIVWVPIFLDCVRAFAGEEHLLSTFYWLLAFVLLGFGRGVGTEVMVRRFAGESKFRGSYFSSDEIVSVGRFMWS